MAPVLEQGLTRLITLRGKLDVPAAARLRDTILAFDATDSVIVDCCQAREIEDAALAFLAWSTISRGRLVELCGLCDHHLRLLRYLGVDGSQGRAMSRDEDDG